MWMRCYGNSSHVVLLNKKKTNPPRTPGQSVLHALPPLLPKLVQEACITTHVAHMYKKMQKDKQQRKTYSPSGFDFTKFQRRGGWIEPPKGDMKSTPSCFQNPRTYWGPYANWKKISYGSIRFPVAFSVLYPAFNSPVDSERRINTTPKRKLNWQ